MVLTIWRLLHKLRRFDPLFRSLENLCSFKPYILAKLRKMYFVNKSYVGDSKSYVAVNKSYVGIIKSFEEFVSLRRRCISPMSNISNILHVANSHTIGIKIVDKTKSISHVINFLGTKQSVMWLPKNDLCIVSVLIKNSIDVFLCRISSVEFVSRNFSASHV